MVRLRIAGAALMVTILVDANGSASATPSTPTAAPADFTEPKPGPSREPPSLSATLPRDFRAPTLAEAPNFKLAPLGPDLVKVDYDAYMSSIEHLQKTFTRNRDWPTKVITEADSMRDMQNEQGRFQKRESFAYAILTPDGSRERGSVYVSPSTVPGYDAVVRMWVTKAEYDAGFEAELYPWVTEWVNANWPFRNVAYPGRAIGWDAWDAMVAASKTPKAASVP